MIMIKLYARQKKRHRCIVDFWTLWEKVRVGWSEIIESKHVFYQVWNRLSVQVGCMRQGLGAGALGWPRGMRWGGRWEGGSGWGIHVNPWLIHINIWQKPLQYCKVIQFSSVQFSCSVVSNSLRPHELQHTRPPCPSPTPGVYSDSFPSSWWCHPAISSSVVPFSSCPQSLPASGSFPMSQQLFAWSGQSIGVSASASVCPMNTQDWCPLGWIGWISLKSKGLSRVFSNATVQKHQFFSTQLSSQSNSHIHTWPLE